MSAALFAPATRMRLRFEHRARSSIGSMIRSPATARCDWIMTAPLAVDMRLPADRAGPSGGTRDGDLGGEGGGAGGAPLAAHVELENAGHHDHGLRPIPVLEHREFHRFGAVHEHSTAQAGLVLDDPVTAAVLAHSEQGFRTTARGR